LQTGLKRRTHGRAALPAPTAAIEAFAARLDHFELASELHAAGVERFLRWGAEGVFAASMQQRASAAERFALLFEFGMAAAAAEVEARHRAVGFR
jgi:hypothetical protein